MSVFGSKMGFDGGLHIIPETLGELYKEINKDYPKLRIIKPYPGQSLLKLKRPVSSIDGPAFRMLPDEIQIIQPPRLYRSKAWKYQGCFHTDCETNWEVEFKYNHNNETRYRWLPVRVLLFCYKPVLKQLTLF